MLTPAQRDSFAGAEVDAGVTARMYPSLQQHEPSPTECTVAFSRLFATDIAHKSNAAVENIATNFLAGFATVTEREFYEVEDPQYRNVPKVPYKQKKAINDFRTQQSANKGKTYFRLASMGLLTDLVAYAALTYFGTGTSTFILPLAFRILLIGVWGSYYGPYKLD